MKGRWTLEIKDEALSGHRARVFEGGVALKLRRRRSPRGREMLRCLRLSSQLDVWRKDSRFLPVGDTKQNVCDFMEDNPSDDITRCMKSRVA